MKKGSHIFVWKTGYTHHGIYDGNGNVIQYDGFSNDINKGPINITSLDEFAGESDIYIRKYSIVDIKYSGDEIVQRSLSRVGESMYDLQANNCEHFCTWAITDKHESGQVKFTEEMIESINPTIAKIFKVRRYIKENSIKSQISKNGTDDKGEIKMGNKNKLNSIIHIKPTKGKVLPSVEMGSGLIPLLKALNPLETFGRIIVEINAYKVEAKRLEIERDRIKEQANIIEKNLESQLSYKLRELEVRRQAILARINKIDVSANVCSLNAESFGLALDNAMNQMNQLVKKKQLPPPEIFEIYNKIVTQLTEKMVKVGKQGVKQTISMTQTLNIMISETRNELEEIHPIDQVLSLPEN
ncbi:lecithin retinol acyltransferase family protein [Desulfococcaceae bacterium HSG9]|nr:lecithin retinol acyltransferase family protein [Desulfococcaceae bacterium HSG9]